MVNIKYSKNKTMYGIIVTIFMLVIMFCITSGTVYATSYGTNLVLNGDSETNSLANWTNSGPVFVALSPSGSGVSNSPSGGYAFDYYPGSASGSETLSQEIDISDISADIASGRVSAELSGELKRFYANSSCILRLEQLNASGTVLTGSAIGATTCGDAWGTQTLTVSSFDANTVKLRVVLYAEVSTNTDDYIEFDDIQLKLYRVPTVTTTSVSTYGSSSATLGGNVTYNGGAIVTERGVVYSSTDTTPTIGETGVTTEAIGTGTGSFSEVISGLNSGTTYYVQAYATNAVGTSYGGIHSFTTGYTISGNAGVSGVALSYTDGAVKTAIADSNGDYSFDVSYNWSGTVTPSLIGYIFSDISKTYSNVLTNQGGQDYIATPTYIISGNVGVSGAAISYHDGTDKTVTADSSGDYSFTIPSGWSGTVTPSLAGYTFSAVRTYTSVAANQTAQDFTASAITYTISGNATVSSAALNYTDGTTKTATADSNGDYSFTVSYNWSGTVTASAAGYTFSAAKTYTNVLANQTVQDFTASAITYTISGNAIVSGAALTYVDGITKTATAASNGDYSFNVSYNWSGTVTASAVGYTFSTAKTYTNVLANQTAQNFTATATTYTISGNAGVSGVTITYQDGTTKTATTDGSGNYSFLVSYNWSGNVTPSKSGYVFTDASKTYANVLANQTGQDYTAIAAYVISGNAGVSGAAISYHDGTDKTVTADSSGDYSFSILSGWSGTVTPSKTGYTFSNASKNYTSVAANQTNQDYTATAITYTISGNAGVSGAAISYHDGTDKTATADGSGNYSFAVSYNWSGTVTPSTVGYTFSSAKTYANVLVNQTAQNYTATAITYTISGNAAASGAVLSYTDGTSKTATAGSNGDYSFAVSYNWSGTVSPSALGYIFTTTKTYTNVLANQTAQNYTATLITFTISGNAGITGAALSYTDGSTKTATADASGNYSFTVSYGWSGTVTPSLSGYTFAARTYANVTSDQTAQNYTATVATTLSGNGSGSSSNKTTEPSDANVVVNGETQTAGTATTATIDGKTTTTVTIDSAKLEKLLETKGNNATVTIPVQTGSDVVVGELNGLSVKQMEEKEAVLQITTDTVSYTLPASEINIDEILKQIGGNVQLKNIVVKVSIAEPSAETVRIVEDTAKENSYQIIVKPIEFEITCTSEGKTVDVSKFNGYVERTVEIPDGIDPSKITTGIVLNDDGTFRHVPTTIVLINGIYYAKINSLTNSTYSVIYNPVEFADVANHWAKDSVNNMGSRMVVTGIDETNYAPNREITRAEFATIIVRALGLGEGTGNSSFSDVKTTDWYSGYIETAASYGIISGYNATTFGPKDKITRQQAMVMIARAMEITGLEASLTDSEISTLLASYFDSASASNYAKESIAACLKTSIVSGRSGNTIAPKSYITRAEVAAIVERLLQKSELI